MSAGRPEEHGLGRQDLEAVIEARRDLGPTYEPAIVESLAEKVEQAIDARADCILGGLADETTIVHYKINCTPVKTLCMYGIELSYDFEPVLLGPIFSPTIVASGEMPVEAIHP